MITSLQQAKESLYVYRATLDRVVDGDTIDVYLDFGFHLKQLQRFRLYGIDTPEIRGAEKQAGRIAKTFVEQLVAPASAAGMLFVESYKDTSGKYGRYLGTFWLPTTDEQFASDGTWTSLNVLLVKTGNAEERFY